MQKSKGIKIAALLCGATVAIAGIALAATHFLKGQEFYRSILIYELQGSANIEREGAGNIKAAEDLYLESGDRLTVADGSSMRLKLDDDKYVMVEENSVLAIEAAGNEEDSKTKIQLEQGAITSEIQNPLSTDSTYEVNSPNSVMAVRGTIFRVETETDEDGENYTKVSVFDGKVSMGALLADGSVGEEILINAGEEADCTGSAPTGALLSEPAEIDYQSLPLQALNFLLDLAKNNAPITGATQEDLSGFVEEAESWEEDDSDYEEDVDDTEDDTENDTDDVESWEEDDTDDVDDTSSQDNNSSSTGSYNSASTGTSGGTRYQGNTGTTPSSNPSTTPSNNPSTTPNSNPGTTPGNNPSTTPGSNSGATEGDGFGNKPSNHPAKKPGTTPGNNPGNTPDNNPTNKPLDTPGNTPGNDSEDIKPNLYKVTFIYDGKVFATQAVKSGECAKRPVLMPDKSGDWDFDFTTKIEKDTTIKWK